MSMSRCPVCKEPSVQAYRPFCSRGCKDRDLLKWLDDGYRIPGPAVDPDLANSGVDKADDRD